MTNKFRGINGNEIHLKHLKHTARSCYGWVYWPMLCKIPNPPHASQSLTFSCSHFRRWHSSRRLLMCLRYGRRKPRNFRWFDWHTRVLIAHSISEQVEDVRYFMWDCLRGDKEGNMGGNSTSLFASFSFAFEDFFQSSFFEQRLLGLQAAITSVAPLARDGLAQRK